MKSLTHNQVKCHLTTKKTSKLNICSHLGGCKVVTEMNRRSHMSSTGLRT